LNEAKTPDEEPKEVEKVEPAKEDTKAESQIDTSKFQVSVTKKGEG